MVDTLHRFGMCVSYDRLLQFSSDITNGICQHFQIEDVVCPSKLRQNLFTTAAVDNIDHNPSSATAKDSFHCTMPTFEEWCTQSAEESVHFNNSLKSLSLELLLLRYIRSIREANSQLYMESQMIPWMFALDRRNDPRWFSVHIRDMMTLGKKNHPVVLREFEDENFVVQKTTNPVSAVVIGQCYEQNNGMVKGSGGSNWADRQPASTQTLDGGRA